MPRAHPPGSPRDIGRASNLALGVIEQDVTSDSGALLLPGVNANQGLMHCGECVRTVLASLLSCAAVLESGGGAVRARRRFEGRCAGGSWWVVQ